MTPLMLGEKNQHNDGDGTNIVSVCQYWGGYSSESFVWPYDYQMFIDTLRTLFRYVMAEAERKIRMSIDTGMVVVIFISLMYMVLVFGLLFYVKNDWCDLLFKNFTVKNICSEKWRRKNVYKILMINESVIDSGRSQYTSRILHKNDLMVISISSYESDIFLESTNLKQDEL